MEPRCSNCSLQRILRSSAATKQAASGNQRKHSSEGVSFIKLLGGDFSKQLQIPNEFIINFNGHVPHRFIVESAMTKEAWRVEVQKEKDGAIYFREGWADFVKAHLLEEGNFLLFEYEEQSILVVKVYNKDGCQKMVLDTQWGKNNVVKMTDFEEQDESDTSDYEPTSINFCEENTKSVFTRKHGNYGKHRTLSKSDRNTRMLFAENDMAFSIKMNNSKKYQFRQRMIPKSISLAHNLMKKDSVTLEDATGNCWPVRLSILSDGRVRLGFGWTTFLEGNEVAAGDLLSFKFVTDDLLKVQVTKAGEIELHSKETNSQTGANLSPNLDCEIDKANACNADVNPPPASSHTKRCSSEGTINTSSHRKRRSFEGTSFSFSFLREPTSTPGAYMHVPRVVTEAQNLMNKDTVVLRDPVGKCWPIEVRPRGDGRVALTRGWSDFCKGQAFKVGDSLNFKFISEYVAEVEINRGDQLKSPFKVEEGMINLQYDE